MAESFLKLVGFAPLIDGPPCPFKDFIEKLLFLFWSECVLFPNLTRMIPLVVQSYLLVAQV